MYIVNKHGVVHTIPDDWTLPAGARKATKEEAEAYEAGNYKIDLNTYINQVAAAEAAKEAAKAPVEPLTGEQVNTQQNTPPVEPKVKK